MEDRAAGEARSNYREMTSVLPERTCRGPRSHSAMRTVGFLRRRGSPHNLLGNFSMLNLAAYGNHRLRNILFFAASIWLFWTNGIAAKDPFEDSSTTHPDHITNQNRVHSEIDLKTQIYNCYTKSDTEYLLTITAIDNLPVKLVGKMAVRRKELGYGSWPSTTSVAEGAHELSMRISGIDPVPLNFTPNTTSPDIEMKINISSVYYHLWACVHDSVFEIWLESDSGDVAGRLIVGWHGK